MPAASSSSSSPSDAALRLPIFGAEVERGCFVKTVDFTKHGDKANAPPEVVELHNEKELLEHLSWTYHVSSSGSNTAAAGGDDKAPQRQLPHDVLSVYLIRNCPWARSAILSTNLTAPIPDFAAAARNTLRVHPSEPVLSIKTFQHSAPEDAPTASGLVPYAANDTLSAISLHYPWYRQKSSRLEPGKGKYKLMDLRQPDGEFIEVNKARLSMMVHEPAWPEGMEEETRVMAGVMVLFDDWLLDEEEDDKIDEEEESDVDDYDAGLKATAQPQSPKREKEQVEDTGCLNPIALRFFEDWTTCGYILSRSILLAKFYGMIMKWEFDNCSHVAGMSELHLSCNKEHILTAPSNPTLAHEIHRSEQLFQHLSTHLSLLPTSLPEWLIYHIRSGSGTINQYAFQHWPLAQRALNPLYVPPSQPLPKRYTVQEAGEMVFGSVRERFEKLIIGTEKNMQLLHTVAILQESRRSVEQAESVRRLTWITFVFLPAMAVSSIFGMNVTAFAKDISIVWFFVCAIPLVAVVLLAWWGFRKWNQREREMRMGKWSGGERRRGNKRRNKTAKGKSWWGLWKRNRSNAKRKDHLC